MPPPGGTSSITGSMARVNVVPVRRRLAAYARSVAPHSTRDVFPGIYDLRARGGPGLRTDVIAAGTIEAWSYVDATATAMLSQLRAELAREGITLGIARAKGRLREIFDATGLSDEIGREYLFPTVRAAVKAFGERADGDGMS